MITPGPWRKMGKSVVFSASGEGWKGAEIGGLNAEDNARLIAAAPDLLVACKSAVILYDLLALSPLESAVKYGPDYIPPGDEEILAIRGELENAIAKAEE